MHCASCAKNIEAQVKKHPGVKSVNVNFATSEMFVRAEEFVPEIDLKKIVEELGYKVIGKVREQEIEEQKEITKSKIASNFCFALEFSFNGDNGPNVFW